MRWIFETRSKHGIERGHLKQIDESLSVVGGRISIIKGYAFENTERGDGGGLAARTGGPRRIR